MAVDRANRDLLADVLAAYLRRDIDESELYERLRPVERFIEPFAQVGEPEDALLPYCGECLYGPLGFGINSQQDWERICRCIVFLDTDREYTPPAGTLSGQGPGPGPLDDPRHYRLHLLGFLTSGILVFFEGLWPLLSWWVVSFVLLFVIGNLREGRRWQEWTARNPRPPDFGPFRDEDEWRANAYRLNRFRIPPYDPEVYAPPPSNSSWIGKLIGYTLAITFIVGIGLLVIGITLLFWPLSVLSGSFASPDNPPGESGPVDSR